MNERLARLQLNLERVRERIAAAARQAGRDPQDVRLVGVSKYAGDETTRELALAGCLDLGESRPQDLWRKGPLLRDLSVRWHQIGHLQRNKVRRSLPWTWLIHSVDSPRLLAAVEKNAEELHDEIERPNCDLLLEVNVSGDESKHGLRPDDCRSVVEMAEGMHHARVRGLMCMAGRDSGEDGARRDFAALRELRDKLQREFPQGSLRELSMGMSGDFEQAIAEGSTMVRDGAALFEGVDGIK